MSTNMIRNRLRQRLRDNQTTYGLWVTVESPSITEIDDILAIPGLEAIFFGPADLSAAYGHLGSWDEHGLADILTDIKAKAGAKGIASGILARGVEDSISRRDQGFRMIALGADMTLLVRAIGENLVQLGQDVTPRLWF